MFSGYETSDAYGWSNQIFGLAPADGCLTEEASHSQVDWNYEELDASINNYNVSLTCWFPLVDKRLVPTAPLVARFRL